LPVRNKVVWDDIKKIEVFRSDENGVISVRLKIGLFWHGMTTWDDRALPFVTKVCRLLSIAGIALALAPMVYADEWGAAYHFEQIKGHPPTLRLFLAQFPKGGDLHKHLDGAIFAETYLQWAAEDGKCIDLNTAQLSLPPCDGKSVSDVIDDVPIVNRLIDAFSIRNYERRSVSGHDHFFATFGRFAAATVGREADMIADVRRRASRENVNYLELMQIFGMQEAMKVGRENRHWADLTTEDTLIADKQLGDLVNEVLAKTDIIEEDVQRQLGCEMDPGNDGCDVTVRYLSTVLRGLTKAEVAAQSLVATKLVAQDPRYVGINLAMPEDMPKVLENYSWQMALVRDLMNKFPLARPGLTLHAGELSMGLVSPDELRHHIGEAVFVAGARRIGHGTAIAFEDNAEALLEKMANDKILVEINLSSNAVILGVTGEDHPFTLYQQYGVPVALATDNTGVSRIDFTHEYQRAVETYDLSYVELKTLARNSIEYSFLAGESLFEDIPTATRKEVCRSQPGNIARSPICITFLSRSEKANRQMDLERRFEDFEANYNTE
jgi:hypothetical protein